MTGESKYSHRPVQQGPKVAIGKLQRNSNERLKTDSKIDQKYEQLRKIMNENK